jgi:hypothetical protein
MVIRGERKGCVNTSSTALNVILVKERFLPSLLPQELSGEHWQERYDIIIRNGKQERKARSMLVNWPSYRCKGGKPPGKLAEARNTGGASPLYCLQRLQGA